MPHAAPSLLYIDHEGAIALVHAYLADPYDEVRFLSVGGPAEAVKAVLGAAKIRDTCLRLVRVNGRGREYVGPLHATASPSRLLTKRLPCGQAHGVLYPDTAPAESLTAFTLLLPQAPAASAPAKLLAMIDQRSRLPLHHGWAEWLWKHLDEQGLLTPLAGHGAWVGWDVRWSEHELTEALTTAVRDQLLTIAHSFSRTNPRRGPDDPAGVPHPLR